MRELSFAESRILLEREHGVLHERARRTDDRATVIRERLQTLAILIAQVGKRRARTEEVPPAVSRSLAPVVIEAETLDLAEFCRVVE